MVSACATDPIQLPSFQEAERSEEEVSDPVLLPELCKLPWTTAGCLQRLDVYEDVAEGNTEIAQLNADIARASDSAYDHILSAAKQQQEIGQIRQRMLEAERQDHFWDNVWHRALIIVIAIGAVL